METPTTPPPGNFPSRGIFSLKGSHLRGPHHPSPCKHPFKGIFSLKRQPPARESPFWSFRGPKASKWRLPPALPLGISFRGIFSLKRQHLRGSHRFGVFEAQKLQNGDSHHPSPGKGIFSLKRQPPARESLFGVFEAQKLQNGAPTTLPLQITLLREFSIFRATCEGVTILEFFRPKSFKMETPTTPPPGNHPFKGIFSLKKQHLRGSHRFGVFEAQKLQNGDSHHPFSLKITLLKEVSH